MNTLIDRLARLGIFLELGSNYPWVYLLKVNGVEVTERYLADHGYTIGVQQEDGIKLVGRRELFQLIRKYV